MSTHKRTKQGFFHSLLGRDGDQQSPKQIHNSPSLRLPNTRRSKRRRSLLPNFR